MSDQLLPEQPGGVKSRVTVTGSSIRVQGNAANQLLAAFLSDSQLTQALRDACADSPWAVAVVAEIQRRKGGAS